MKFKTLVSGTIVALVWALLAASSVNAKTIATSTPGLYYDNFTSTTSTLDNQSFCLASRLQGGAADERVATATSPIFFDTASTSSRDRSTTEVADLHPTKVVGPIESTETLGA